MISPLLKRAAVEAMYAQQPLSVVTGKVIQITPELLIQADVKIPLDRDFLIFTQTSSELKLEVGDKLILLKIQGGQSYLVLDKAVT